MNQGALTIQIEINWISGSGKVRFVLPFPKNSKKKKMEGKREKKRGERETERERTFLLSLGFLAWTTVEPHRSAIPVSPPK